VRRLPQIAFATLVAATVAAFFITQHLKVSTPLIGGFPKPVPAYINPLDGTVCGGVDHRRMRVSFYLQHRSDDVDVYVVDQSGAIVRTLASGAHMQGGAHPVRDLFTWNGREDNGRLAPDGIYYVRVALIHQGRTVTISGPSGPYPVTVKKTPPQPVVRSVTPHLIPTGPRTAVTITYSGNQQRGGTVKIYRTDVPGWWRRAPVKSFLTPWKGNRAVWDGMIHRRPAPAGIYLVGLDVTDAACNTGHFPAGLPPSPGSTPGAGVTVRYLAVEPPLVPVRPGSRAVALIDSRRHSYHWSLDRPGARKPLSSGNSASYAVHVPVPAGHAGAYELAVRSGPHATTVPLLAQGAKPARVLVVLPALTWQGLNPVDDDHDGLPNTLSSGSPVKLVRPLDGLPAGFADEAALLAYLDASHHPYDLNTDIGLLDGVGPKLAGHRMVILAGTEEWLPRSLLSGLRSYVMGGGHVLSLGIGSLLRAVTVSRGLAQDPTAPATTDALGATPRAVVMRNKELIGVLTDGLGIFSTTSGVFSGFSSYQPFATPGSGFASAAGVSPSAPTVVGYSLGHGTVVNIALPGFASRLAHDVNSKELVNQVWTVLAG
jgi:FlgD Ig-like domain/N,N-dimethylformamidase beta subunit-like, C-terminal